MTKYLWILVLASFPNFAFSQSENQVSEYLKVYLDKVIGSPNTESKHSVDSILAKDTVISQLTFNIKSGTILYDTYSEQVTHAIGIYVLHKLFSVYESFRIDPDRYFVSIELNRNDDSSLTSAENKETEVLGPLKFSYYVAFTISDKGVVQSIKLFGNSYSSLNFSKYKCPKGSFIYCVLNESSLGMAEGRSRLLVFSATKEFRLVYQRRIYDYRDYGSGGRIVELLKFRFVNSTVVVEGPHYETDKSKKTTLTEIKESADLGEVEIAAF